MTKVKFSFALLIALALLILGARLHLIESYASHVPFYDDWGMGGALQEYESGELSLEAMFRPVNGHLRLWRTALQFFLFDVNQSQWDTRMQMAVNAIIWALTGVLLIHVLSRRQDGLAPSLIIPAVLLLWVFPTSFLNTLWGVQTHSYFMLLFSLMALWLTSAEPWSKSWYWGVFFAFAAPLTMGGGALTAPAILAVFIARFIFDQASRRKIMPTVIAMSTLTLYSLWVLLYSSGGHDVYYARSVSDFFTTLAKSLSFPLFRQTWPGLVLLLPLVVLGVQVIRRGGWQNRQLLFVLGLFAYTFALCVTIAYARGANGIPPSERYFEFLQLTVLGSFLALVLLQSRRYALPAGVNSGLVLAWAAVFVLGAVTQIQHFNETLARWQKDKPEQEQVVRAYLSSGDRDTLSDRRLSHLPFPTGSGLMRFIDKIAQEDIFSYEMQVPPPLHASAESTAFSVNGTFKQSTGDMKYRYYLEDVMGSYTPMHGGMAAVGDYHSQMMATNRKQLMIPVTGYLGYPDTSLKVVDLKTGEETPVVPKELGSEFAEVWREVFVPAPENAFKLVATDNSASLWFGFAAPRTVGEVSVITNWLIRHGGLFWQLALLWILFLRRDLLVQVLRTEH